MGRSRLKLVEWSWGRWGNSALGSKPWKGISKRRYKSSSKTLKWQQELQFRRRTSSMRLWSMFSGPLLLAIDSLMIIPSLWTWSVERLRKYKAQNNLAGIGTIWLELPTMPFTEFSKKQGIRGIQLHFHGWSPWFLGSQVGRLYLTASKHLWVRW